MRGNATLGPRLTAYVQERKYVYFTECPYKYGSPVDLRSFPGCLAASVVATYWMVELLESESSQSDCQITDPVLNPVSEGIW